MRKLILFSFLFALNVFAQEGLGTLEFQIEGFRNNQGFARLLLFNKAEGFPDQLEKAYKQLSLTIKDQKAYFRLEGIPYGTYAMSVMHDENNNQKLDTNFFRFPLEGYACSTNSKIKWRKPKFQDALFKIESKQRVELIQMTYL